MSLTTHIFLKTTSSVSFLYIIGYGFQEEFKKYICADLFCTPWLSTKLFPWMIPLIGTIPQWSNRGTATAHIIMLRLLQRINILRTLIRLSLIILETFRIQMIGHVAHIPLRIPNVWLYTRVYYFKFGGSKPHIQTT